MSHSNSSYLQQEVVDDGDRIDGSGSHDVDDADDAAAAAADDDLKNLLLYISVPKVLSLCMLSSFHVSKGVSQ